MALITDTITPADLTGVARLAAENQDADQATFAQFLPNTQINDTVARTRDVDNSRGEAAQLRAFDAEAPIAAAKGVKQVTFDLPALGQKIRVGELSQIRARSLPDSAMQDILGRTAIQVGRAIADRVEMLRAEALVTGGLSVQENGVVADIDFGRDAKMEPVVGTSWEDEKATPLSDLLEWSEAYAALNGVEPGALVISKQALLKMTKNKEIVSTATDKASASSVSPAVVAEVFGQFGFNNIITYDRQVNVGGTVQRVTPADRVLMLPVAADVQAGVTVFGTTVEATDPAYDYGIDQNDAPGIVVGAFRQNDPASVWIHGNAIAAPVLVNPNLALSATISK